MKNFKMKPTTYLVVEYDENDKKVREIPYPKHLYSLEQVMNMYNDSRYDIYEARYRKHRNKYVTVGDTYTFENGIGWHQLF